ncbi:MULTISPECIES: substrate-binding domain-containing protein [unclassified Mesorhizobium]|uniref:substrate-binding domain-containing protein n=1 Tax=unclassified Mesorhizobium TaxID=325217 RepID=UPI001FE08B69|nr:MULTISPECIES: substrate-binding domain-containing protein [unclassified Mesorhizobium]
MKFRRNNAAATLLALGMLTGQTMQAHAEAEKSKVYLSLSITGNDWMKQAENMIRAEAASSALSDKVDLEVQVSGGDAQKQSQQINAMVQAGAKAIIVYPASETLLNRAVKNACDKGVVVMAFAATISEPCAHNVNADQSDWARVGAQWLVDTLHGKGNIIMVTGATGLGVDTQRNKAAKEVFDKYPDIKIVATVIGMWNETIVRSEMSKLLATRSWDTIDGLWVQEGCAALGAMQDDAGIPDGKKKPMACSASNGERIQMLPANTKIDGATGAYRPMGYPGISMASGPYMGALSLKYAVEIMDGAKMEHDIVIKTDAATSDKMKLCEEGTWKEMDETKCNVFKPSVISSPSWYSPIYSPELPGLGLQAALNGTADK